MGTTLHILLVPLPRRRADEEIRRHIKRYMEALAKALDLLEPQQKEEVMRKITKRAKESASEEEDNTSELDVTGMFDGYRHKKRVQFNGGQKKRRPMNGVNGNATQSADAMSMPDMAAQTEETTTTERAATEDEKQPTPRRVGVQEEAPAETNAQSTSSPASIRVGVSLRNAIPVDGSDDRKLMPPKPKSVAPTADPDKELKEILTKILLSSANDQIDTLTKQALPLIESRVNNAIQHYRQKAGPTFFNKANLLFYRHAIVDTCHMMYYFTLKEGRQASPGYKALMKWVDQMLSKFEPELVAIVAQRRLEVLDRLGRFDKLFFALDLQMWLARCQMGQESENDLMESAKKLVDGFNQYNRSVVLKNLAEHMYKGIKTKASLQLANRLGWSLPEEAEPLTRVVELHKRLKNIEYNKQSTSEWLERAREALKDGVELLLIAETDSGRTSARDKLGEAQLAAADAHAQWLAEHTALDDRELLKWAGYGLMLIDLLQIKPRFANMTNVGQLLLNGSIAQDIGSKKDAADKIVSATNPRVHGALQSAKEENSILVATFCILDYAIRATINSGKKAPKEVFPPRRLWSEDLMGAKLPHSRVLILPALQAIEEDHRRAKTTEVQAELKEYFDYLAERVNWRSTDNNDTKLIADEIKLRMVANELQTARLAAIPEGNDDGTDLVPQSSPSGSATPQQLKRTLQPSKKHLEISQSHLPVYDQYGDERVISKKADGKQQEVKEQATAQPSGLLSQFRQKWGSSTGFQQGSPGYVQGMQYYPSSNSEETSPDDIRMYASDEDSVRPDPASPTHPSSSATGNYIPKMQFDTGTVFFTDRDYTKHCANVQHRQNEQAFWSKLTFEEAEILSRPINWVLLPYCTMGGAPAPIIAHTNPICGHYGSDWVVRSFLFLYCLVFV